MNYDREIMSKKYKKIEFFGIQIKYAHQKKEKTISVTNSVLIIVPALNFLFILFVKHNLFKKKIFFFFCILIKII